MSAATLPPNYFDATATVLTRGSGGDFTVSARTGLACRLVNLSGPDPRSSPERAALASAPALIWEAGYVMPDVAQVQITAHPDSTLVNTKWAPVRGTLSAPADWTNAITYRRAEVSKVA
jgi:hypothetical protein